MNRLLTLLFIATLYSAPAMAQETAPVAAADNSVAVEAQATGQLAEGVEILPEAPAPKSDRVEYVEDPEYVPLGGPGNHPMQELFDLAEDNDPRAQYILADLYSKGKGGIGKNVPLGKMLFEHSAKLGNHEALIRLAALAKREGDMVEAYKWYDLAVARLVQGDYVRWARESRAALNLSAGDKKRADAAARKWEQTKLEPLNLHTPLNPIKETTPLNPEVETKTTE